MKSDSTDSSGERTGDHSEASGGKLKNDNEINKVKQDEIDRASSNLGDQDIDITEGLEHKEGGTNSNKHIIKEMENKHSKIVHGGSDEDNSVSFSGYSSSADIDDIKTPLTGKKSFKRIKHGDKEIFQDEVSIGFEDNGLLNKENKVKSNSTKNNTQGSKNSSSSKSVNANGKGCGKKHVEQHGLKIDDINEMEVPRYEDPFKWKKPGCCGRTGFWIRILILLFIKSFFMMLGYFMKFLCHPRTAYERFTHHLLYKTFGADVFLIGKNIEGINSFRGVVMTTHKSYLDFVNAPVFGYCSALGRFGAALIIPAGSCFTCCTKSFLVFCRGAAHDWDKFGKKIKNFTNDRAPRIMVYPEGHRNRQGRGCQRLRTGIFRICFDQKIPVFLAPCEGAQFIISEFQCFRKKRMPLVINYVGSVDPNQYEDWKSFYDACEVKFRTGYDESIRFYDKLVGHVNDLQKSTDEVDLGENESREQSAKLNVGK